MAGISKYRVGKYEYCKITDKSTGHVMQYSVKLEKYSQRQWLAAHDAVMRSIDPQERIDITSGQLKGLVAEWLETPKEKRALARASGLRIEGGDGLGEASIGAVAESYLSDFCQPKINSQHAISRAQRQCRLILSFLRENKIFRYSQLRRETLIKYPDWRGGKSADTVNQDYRRLGAIIRHGVKYCGWKERYLLDGLRVKATTENTKAVRPFEIAEVKAIFEWLRNYSENSGNWHLHDMALLSVCSGLEAKALTLLKREWFKMDLGILRVYDKLVSGVIDAKTQNRARDIPLTPTLRELFERGHIFSRPEKKRGRVAEGHTNIKDWSRRAFAKCESDTGIAHVDWHRFRHTCATARLSAGWQLIRVSRMLGHKSVNTTASHYAEYDLSASPAGFEGMLKAYGEFADWLDCGYFGA